MMSSVARCILLLSLSAIANGNHCAGGEDASGHCSGYECGDSSCNSPATQCEAGWYGSTCIHSCPSHCADAVCLKSGHCNGYECDDSSCDSPASQCETGWYGSTCIHSCPSHCADAVCLKSGHCNGYECDDSSCDSPASQCETGWYGSTCIHSCPSDCKDTGCLKNGNCPGNGGTDTDKRAYIAPRNAATVRRPFIISLKAGDSSCTDDDGFNRTEECSSPNGTASCAFYDDCLEASHQCGAEGYTQKFGLPMCEKFLDLEGDPSVSAAELAWMRYVRSCLQTAASPLVYDSELSCDDLQNAAFESHVACYTAPGSSICTNPGAWWDIVQIVGPELLGYTPSTAAIMGNVASVVVECGRQYASIVITGVLQFWAEVVGDFIELLSDADVAIAAAAEALQKSMYSLGPVADASQGVLKFDSSVEATVLSNFSAFCSGLGSAIDSTYNGSSGFLATVNAAAGVFNDSALWVVDSEAGTIRLTSQPDVAYEDMLTEFYGNCSRGGYAGCGYAATSIVYSVAAGA